MNFKIKKKCFLFFCFFCFILFLTSIVFNKTQSKNNRSLHHGEGPFKRLIIRGVTLIDGTGGPPIGPYDVVIEGNRIAEVRSLGYPGVKIPDTLRPKNAEYEIDAHGMFMLPGLVSTHSHIGVPKLGLPAEYIYKLMLGHGVTTIREPGSDNGIDWTLEERARSKKNEIVAPRIFVYVRAKKWNSVNPLKTPEKAREWVREVAKKGIDGLKLGAHDPDIMAALIDEAKKHGLGTMAHLDRHGLMRMNTLDAARLGLGTAIHVLGLFESLFEKRTIPDLPPDYRPNIYNTRLYETGRLWRQAAKQGSEKWNEVMRELLQSGIVLEPTFVPYNICRDVSKARNAVWHKEYTLPVLLDFWKPRPSSHFTFYSDWTTTHETEWKNLFKVWMNFINEYKNKGGKVTAGPDAGYGYCLYGFTYIQELELLQEAGFHPLEVIRSATLYGAETLFEPKGEPVQFGIIRPGKLADLILVEENPLNLKILYGTGHMQVDNTGKFKPLGGVKYTIKDGIIYDAKLLLKEVRDIVFEAKKGN